MTSVKLQRFHKGELIDTYHHLIFRLRQRVGPEGDREVFDLFERSEDRVVERAFEIGWHYDCLPGYFPFVPVFPEESMGLQERVAMTRDQTSTRPGVTDLHPGGLHDLHAPPSRSQPYMLMGVILWRDPRVATTTEEARAVIRIKGRRGLSTNEMLSFALQGLHYSFEYRDQPMVICALGSMYSGHQHNLPHEFQTPALCLHPEAPQGPTLSSCSPNSAPGPFAYMPFCIERMELAV